jgi:VanZ family protein
LILLFRAAFFTALAGITTLAFLPDYSALPPLVSVSDLANHAAAFVVLALLYSLSYPHSQKRIAATLLVYGVFIEAVQALLPTRYASLEDIAADSVGLIIGMMVQRGIRIRRVSPPKGEQN